MTRVNSLYQPTFRGEYHNFPQLNVPALVLKEHKNQNDESRIIQDSAGLYGFLTYIYLKCETYKNSC